MQEWLTTEEGPLELHGVKVKVGDRAIISRPASMDRYAEQIERLSTVTAIRPQSFDAGGLCFRYDGREWSGHNRVELIPREEEEIENRLLAVARETELLERAERGRDDIILAFVLSRIHEKRWLRLGVEELKRIAVLHGITSPKAEALGSSFNQLSSLPVVEPSDA